ncbi:hypothetical protein T492DRAFT_882564 [Pavlovales sp. CCMP2436]|nr:hypothetical protein T492DRAFT_882564 [Pavlovales sp. CCMP2436]
MPIERAAMRDAAFAAARAVVGRAVAHAGGAAVRSLPRTLSSGDPPAVDEPADFRPFNLLNDGLILAIFRCLPDLESLGCAAKVSTRFAELKGFLALPSKGAGWREQYKQWHALSSLSWSHCPPAAGSAQPSARSLHIAAAVSADRAYVFGGYNAYNEVLRDLWMLRCDAPATGTASWELVAPTSEHTPIARIAATLSPVSLSDSVHSVGLLLFGGDDGESFLDDVWFFDTRTAAWTMLLPHTAQAADASVRPDGRAGHSAITRNSSSEVVIIGGVTEDEGILNNVLSFSMCTRKWTRHECAGVSPIPRSGHAACRMAESMYVFGGESNDDSLNDLREYALDTRAWTQVVGAGGSAPSPRSGHSLISIGNRLVVFFGDLFNSFDSVLHCFDLQRRRWSGLASHPGGSRSCEQAARGLWWRQRRGGCTVPAALALAIILVHAALSGTRRTAGAFLVQEAAAESAGGRAMDVDELYFLVVGDWGAPFERPQSSKPLPMPNGAKSSIAADAVANAAGTSSLRRMMRSEEADFHPFDLLDDGLVLAILRCLNEPESLGCAAQVCTCIAGLCEESYAWRPLPGVGLLALLPSGEGFLALPSQGAGWRERYKQWHTLSSLSWSHCPPAASSAHSVARSTHGAAAVSAYRAYLGDLWMFRCDSAATGTASWELVAPTSEHTPIACNMATLSPVSLSDSVHPVGLLLFGRHGGGSFLGDVWLFDTRTAAWTMLLPHTAQTADASVRPDGRCAHSAITRNSRSEVVIFDGFADESYFNDVLSFGVRTRQWTRHECAGASPSPRVGHAACRVAESMYVFGGRSGGGWLNDLWEYALDTRHSLIPFGNRLVVFFGDLANSLDSALHCFDLQRRRWSDFVAGGEHPRARIGHTVIPCGGGALIFGGYGSGGKHFNDTFLLRVWP